MGPVGRLQYRIQAAHILRTETLVVFVRRFHPLEKGCSLRSQLATARRVLALRSACDSGQRVKDCRTTDTEHYRNPPAKLSTTFAVSNRRLLRRSTQTRRYLRDAHAERLTHIYIACPCLVGHHPPQWREGTVLIIPKPNRADPSEALIERLHIRRIVARASSERSEPSKSLAAHSPRYPLSAARSAELSPPDPPAKSTSNVNKLLDWSLSDSEKTWLAK
jgi:hypothetical protein